jgi:hypothetical protein
MNQNDIEPRIRTLRILWIALLFSLCGFFLMTILQKPREEITPNPTLSLILLLVGVSTTLTSFLIRSRLVDRAVEQRQAPLVHQAYVMGWAINEASALLGVADFFLTGHRHYYLLFIISGCGLLLQFPRREPVMNAAFKSPGF